ncbi:AMP-binding protein [Streptomyces sp. NPDC007818]|uniref:AMP-binding protein n=1 Tax=Streptomyces sp. NPDC007818 TaxID=3364780 RepID=UPI00369A89C8
MSGSTTRLTRVSLLRRNAAERPDHVVLATVDGPALSHREWDVRSDGLARLLAARGLRPGGRVVVVLGEEEWVLLACWHAAVLKSGATVLPVSSRFTAAEVAGLVEDVRPTHVVARRRPPALPAEARWVDAAEEPSAAADPRPLPEPAPAEVSELVCTSGTTGRPKLIACSEENLLAPLALAADSGHVVPVRPERSLHSTVIGTAGGQRVLNSAYTGGGSVHLGLADPTPRRLLDAVVRHRPDRLGLVPATAAALVRAGADGHDLTGVRMVTVSTAAASPALLTALQELFPAARILRMYGATEILPAGAATVFDPARPEVVGAPVGRTLISVRDEDFAVLPPGRTGRVWLRYPGAPPRRLWVAPGTVRPLDREGWLWAGDLGSVDADGLLSVEGRADDVLNVAGTRVSPAEVEAVLAGHPAVADVAVYGEPAGDSGDRVAAAVVARAPVDAAGLRRFAAGLLARHKVPAAIRFVPELPRGATGKVRRHLLAEPATRETVAPAPPGPAPSPPGPDAGPEAFLRELWAEHTADGAGSDPGATFFDLGGTSLDAMLLMTRLEERFALELPADALYTHPTQEGFTALVTALVAGAARPGEGADHDVHRP